jgi:hypothetical protein
MRLADPGDPQGSEIWLTPTHTLAASATPTIRRIPTADFVAGDNPGAYWEYGKIFGAISANVSPRLWVSPDGQAHASISNNQRHSVYESREATGATNPASSTIDQFDAPSAGIQTIHRDTGSGDAWTADLVGKRIRIPGTAGATNRGSFVVDAFTDADTLDIRNSGGGAEGPAAAVACDFLGAEFSESVTNDVNALIYDGAHPGFPRGDDGGLGYWWRPRGGANAGNHYIWAGTRVHYQWSGSVWYRRELPHIEAAYGRTRTASTSPVSLRSGITAEFLNQNAGVGEFIEGEYYSCGVSPGLFKDPTQELTLNYDFYAEQTDLIDESGTDKTASDGPSAAFRNTEDLGTFPPASTALTFNELQLGHYQRRIRLDGANGTTLKQATGTRNATNGFTVGVDLGSAVAVDRVMFASLCNNNNVWKDILADLYYSDDNVTYTLADSYDGLTDHPEWILYADAFRDFSGDPGTYTNQNTEIEIDVGLIGGAAATPHRYWKLVIRSSSSQSTAHTFTGFTCINTSGAAAGFAADNKIGTADDSNYLANFIQRAVFVQDSGTGSAARGPADNQVTLTADTFDTVAIDDFFRVLSGPAAGFEGKIDSVDSTTQITLTADAPSFSGVNWEVVRNVDVRPRDDEGASEDQARFPSAAGEVFICPVTGYIFYHATDVSASRVMRIDEYVKVRRAL